MAEPSTHINYSFEDIQRYLNGGMSAAEMHAVEKAALQDPFLADAIEGYADANALTVKQHLNEVNAALLGEKKRSKVVAFNKRTQWISVAATIIIICGIGLISFFILNKPNRQNEIAQVRKEAVADSTNLKTNDSAAEQMAPFRETEQQNNVVQNRPQQKQIVTEKEDKQSLSQERNIQHDEANVTAVAAIPAPAQQDEEASKLFTAPSVSNQKNDSVQNILQGKAAGISVASNTFSGKVVDENNKPVPGATIQSADKKETTFTNINGDFTLQQNDTLLNVVAGTVGYETRNAALQPKTNNRIILKENSSALNDVTVTGYSVKARSSTQSAMPVGGWQNFNNYVVSQLNKDSTKDNYMADKDLVELEFLIDQSGNPYNIDIIKPLDERRNLKAIDILKSGPKWTSASKNKKAKVAIAF